MIQLKYASPQIGTMSERELAAWSTALLAKIHVITGWVVPTGNLLNILVDQFEKKLVEDYSNMNTEEIEYAFRSNGTMVKDWGKEMNLNLIDQVLIEYLTNRRRLSAEEEKRNVTPPAQKIYSDEEILNGRRRDIELAYQAMRKGYYPILHRYFAEVLTADGLMKDETLAEFFVRMLSGQVEQLYTNQ